MTGRRDEAMRVFERLCERLSELTNDLGLPAEDYGVNAMRQAATSYRFFSAWPCSKQSSCPGAKPAEQRGKTPTEKGTA